MTTDPLAPVKRLLDEWLPGCSDAKCSCHLIPGVSEAREAVRLLLDVARSMAAGADRVQFVYAADYAQLRALLALVARLEGEKP